MASLPQQRAAIPQLDTVASAIAHPDLDDLAVAVPSVNPLPVATLGLQDSVNPRADWLYFVDWLVAVIQTAAPHGPAQADPIELIRDAAPIAIDAPAAAVVEPLTVAVVVVVVVVVAAAAAAAAAVAADW